MDIRAYWFTAVDNLGDLLNPVILPYFLPKHRVVFYNGIEQPKLLAIGSIMGCILPGDVVWGTGVLRESDTFEHCNRVKFLSVRGPLTRKILIECGGNVPEIYGDPGLLMPFIYNPKIEKKRKVGFVAHYADKPYFAGCIDIQQPWQKVIDEILSCEKIISSSLHGMVIAEAYGIPACFEQGSIEGIRFKFRDYVEGTGRELTDWFLPPIKNLSSIQFQLISRLINHYVFC
jgi:pyruvyltransferase